MCMCVCSFSHVRLFVTSWTVAFQIPLSMGFSRQEYCIELPCPPPRDLPNLEMEAKSLHLLHWQADSLPLSHWEALSWLTLQLICIFSKHWKNTGVGSLALLQGVFPTWESNQSLLHCRQILYQQSHQGSPLEGCLFSDIFVIIWYLPCLAQV